MVKGMNDILCSNAKIYKNLDYAKLFSTLCLHFHSMYILDTEEDLIIPIKETSMIGEVIKGTPIAWNKSLFSMIKSIIKSEYVSSVATFLSKEKVKEAFIASSEPLVKVYQQKTGRWIKATLHPLVLQNGETALAILTLTDINETRKQYAIVSSENK